MSAQDKRAWAYALTVIAGVHALVFAYCTYWAMWHGLPRNDVGARVLRAWCLALVVAWAAWIGATTLFEQADRIDKKNERNQA